MIDMRTVIFSYIISNAICAFVIVSLWLQGRRRLAGLGFWLADFVLQFIALILVALRGLVPDLVSMTGSNVLIIGGTILLIAGLEHFLGKRGTQIHNVILLAVFTLAHIYFVIHPNLEARNIIFSLGLLAVCFHGAWLMFRRAGAEIRTITRGVGIVFIAYCLVSITRVVVDLAVPLDEDFFHSNVYDTLVIMMYQMLFIALTFNLFLMVNRHLIADMERDLVEHEKIETALRLSEEKFYNAFHASPDAIIISRLSDGRLMEVNEGFSRLTDYSQEESLASSSVALNLWANPKDRERCIAALREHHHVHEQEYDFRTKSGKILNGLYSGEVIQLQGEAHILSVVRDITSRKQAEEILRSSEEQHRVILQTAMSGFWQTDIDGHLLEINQAYCQMSGYSEQELLSMKISDLEAAETLDQTASHMHKVMTQGGDRFETRHRHKDGSIIDVEASVQYRDGRFVAFLRDITERKRALDALRDSEQRYRLLFETMERGVIYQGANGQIISANPAAERILGLTLDQMQGWPPMDPRWRAIHEDGSPFPGEIHPATIALRKGIPVFDTVMGVFNPKSNEYRWININAVPQFKDGESIPHQVYIIFDDVTDRRTAEKKLQRAQSQLMEQQSAMAAFNERQRLARDLHDSVNQSIHSLVLFSETLNAVIEKNRFERVKQIAERLQESARQALKETRLMLYELQPSVAGRSVDLVRDLEARLATVEQRAGVKAQIVQEGLLDYCPQDWHENLFWITIEALNNALKHAQARKVQVTIRCSPQHVELEVIDNGKGFDPGKPRAGGLGLRNMHERAAVIGGKITIISTPKQGTTVRVNADIEAKP